MNFLEHFPGTPRSVQEEFLTRLGEMWDNYDVFVVSAPTATGKSYLATSIAEATGQCTIVTPTNLLVEQYRKDFPQYPKLKKADSYKCDTWKSKCNSVHRSKTKVPCPSCPMRRDRAEAFRSGIGVYNYYQLMANKLYRDNLVIDEAHNVLSMLQDLEGKKYWMHTHGYPNTVATYGDVLEWLDSKPKLGKKLQQLKEYLTAPNPRYIVQRTRELWRGSGVKAGRAEMRDVLKLVPICVRDAKDYLWPSKVKKIVLLSATIGRKDIEAMGLDRRRVAYLECQSPIPAENRPIIIDSVVNVNRWNKQESIEDIANYIKQIDEPGKGMVHATYEVARELRKHLTDDKYMFHNSLTTMSQYNKFRRSSEDKVFVASGLYEGVDLAGDEYQWQVLAKIPWISLGDVAVKHKMEQDPEWYDWQVWKLVLQASGRICRGPEDFGRTFIVDSTFKKLYDRSNHLIPTWWKEALEWRES